MPTIPLQQLRLTPHGSLPRIRISTLSVTPSVSRTMTFSSRIALSELSLTTSRARKCHSSWINVLQKQTLLPSFHSLYHTNATIGDNISLSCSRFPQSHLFFFYFSRRIVIPCGKKKCECKTLFFGLLSSLLTSLQTFPVSFTTKHPYCYQSLQFPTVSVPIHTCSLSHRSN